MLNACSVCLPEKRPTAPWPRHDCLRARKPMDQTYLIFGHRGARYGLDVRAVRELVWLPELSPIEELPPYIAGVFNLRGQVVPVMDLGLRFGHARKPFLTSDRIIV